MERTKYGDKRACRACDRARNASRKDDPAHRARTREYARQRSKMEHAGLVAPPSPTRVARGEGHYRSVLTDADVVAMRQAHKDGVPGHILAKQYGIKDPAVSRIVKGLRWKHVAMP